MPYRVIKDQSDGDDRRRRKGKKTAKNSATSARKVVITQRFRQRSEEAVQYRLMGYTFKQIAEEMKCDRALVYRYVRYAMEQEPIEGAAELREMMSAQLKMMLSATLSNAFEGDGEAQDQSRKTMEFFAKLNGLFMPTKVEHSGEVENKQTVFLIRPEDAEL